MNHPLPKIHATSNVITPEVVTYAEWSYVATLDTFDGCLVVTDAQTGKRRATGRNSFGAIVTLPLDVPLCRGCDTEIVGGECRDCEKLFIDSSVSKRADGHSEMWV
jgi:hypothetical protein